VTEKDAAEFMETVAILRRTLLETVAARDRLLEDNDRLRALIQPTEASNMPDLSKPMVCIDCGMQIVATIGAAKADGWRVWVGGAACKRCDEFRVDIPPAWSVVCDAVPATVHVRDVGHVCANPRPRVPR
jgi:hypothetical protein